MRQRRSRQEKYPDTECFHYHNQNPKNRITTDCVIRAISLATDTDYKQVVQDAADIQCNTGYDDGSIQNMNLLMKRYGWVKMNQPRKDDNTKYTGYEWCDWLNNHDNINSTIVANIGGHHTVCFKKTSDDISDDMWKIWDIWDSCNGCVGIYWVKKGW